MWRWILVLCGLLGSGQGAAAAFEVAAQGARTAAMGGAFAAGTDAAEAAWFNPAGNARSRYWHLASTHALLYPGLDGGPTLNGLAGSLPLAGGGLQVAFSALGADDWDEQVGIVGYGRPVHRRLALGLALRNSGWRTRGLSRRAWGVDLGGVFEVGWVHPRAYLQVAAVLSNATRANIAAGGQAAGRTPRGLTLAASLHAGDQRLLLDIERRGGRTEMRAGYEVRALSLAGLSFRMGGSGLSRGWEGQRVDVGLGHRWNEWNIDYAYAYPLTLDGLGGIHRISLGYSQR